MGGIHMKNQPVLGWRLKRELDAKNKEIRDKIKADAEAEEEAWMMEEIRKMEADPDYVYDKAAADLKKWKRARKRIEMGRLFGPYPRAAARSDTVYAEAVTVEAEAR